MNFKSSLLYFIIVVALNLTGDAQNAATYYSNKGKVHFISYSSLETIKATSDELKGIVTSDSKSFAFVVRVVSFDGFNTGLQKDHFNEDYLESERYPNASFEGKLIDDFDFTKDGTATVRAKGILKLHGQEQEKVIKVMLTKKGNVITAKCDFYILLSDYDIRIPRIVHGKISPDIKIDVTIDLVKK